MKKKEEMLPCPLMEQTHEALVRQIHELRAQVEHVASWQPWDSAPKDGSWIIARCNDGTKVYRLSWSIDREGAHRWCSSVGGYFGDGLFNAGGGWIPCPVSSTERA